MLIIALILLGCGIGAAWLTARNTRRPWPRGEHPKFFRQP